MVDRSDDASCLLGLAGLAVECVVRTGLGVKIVQLVTSDPDAARCPACRSLSTSGKDWVLTRPRDLPCGGEFAVVWWRKRRWRCRTPECPRQTFTEQVRQVPAAMRTTTRPRAALAVAVADGRDQSEVAAAHGVSWPTVQRAAVIHVAAALVEPNRRACWAWMRPASAVRGGYPTASMTTAGSGGGARIRGRPGSSTSPVTMPCWGRSTAGPAPSFPPGCLWTPSGGVVRYVDAVPVEVRQPRRAPRPQWDQAVLDEVRDALITAVHRRMMSDVGVGVFLSGGLDSAIIAAIAARRVAEHIGSDRHEVVATVGTIDEALDHAVEVIEHFDPALIRSAVPNLLLARKSAKKIKVVLTGESADDLFAGYSYIHGPEFAAPASVFRRG